MVNEIVDHGAIQEEWTPPVSVSPKGRWPRPFLSHEQDAVSPQKGEDSDVEEEESKSAQQEIPDPSEPKPNLSSLEPPEHKPPASEDSELIFIYLYIYIIFISHLSPQRER